MDELSDEEAVEQAKAKLTPQDKVFSGIAQLFGFDGSLFQKPNDFMHPPQ